MSPAADLQRRIVKFFGDHRHRSKRAMAVATRHGLARSLGLSPTAGWHGHSISGCAAAIPPA
jgi:hypothetical protein